MKKVTRRWSERNAINATRKHLDKIEAHIMAIGALWGDVDEYIVGRAEESRREIETLRVEIEESHTERAQSKADRHQAEADEAAASRSTGVKHAA
jgi:hypothetical protein